MTNDSRRFGFTYGYDDAVTAAMQERTYQWMDIVFVDFGEISGDCLFRKSRPAIVLSGTAYNESSPILTVAPMTRSLKGLDSKYHVFIDREHCNNELNTSGMCMLEHCQAIENKNSLLRFSKEMEQEINEYWKQFTQEDTMAGTIQGWLDAYKGTHVCSVKIWKEAFDHFDREPKKFETNEICSIMDTQITGWKRAGVHRFEKEGYGRQRGWIREGTEDEGVNEPDKDGFTKLTKAEQLELPFDLPDREKG